MKKVNALVLGLAVLLAFGCEKEAPESPVDPVPVQSKTGCWLTRDSVAHANGADQYHYNSDSKLALIDRWNNNGIPWADYETLEYNGNGTIKRHNLYTQDSSLFQYNSYHYNNAGQLTRINTFVSRPDSTLEAKDYKTFAYDAKGRLTENAWFLDPQTLNPNNKEVYHYPSDSTMIERVYVGQTLFTVAEYRFDNKHNPFGGLPLFNGPSSWKHNTTSIKTIFRSDGSTLKEMFVAYVYNSWGYPVKATYTYSDAPRPFNTYYTYNCQ